MDKDELERENKRLQDQLREEQLRREADSKEADYKAWKREDKASSNTASIVFFGGIALAFLLLLF